MSKLNTVSRANTVFIFQNGIHAYKRNEFDVASEYFRNCVKRDPTNWEAQLYLGMVLVQTKQFALAIAHFHNISEKCPEPSLRQRAALAELTLNTLDNVC